MDDEFAYYDNYGEALTLEATNLDDACEEAQALIDATSAPDLQKEADEQMRSVQNTACVCETDDEGNALGELSYEIVSFVHPSEPECIGTDSFGVHDWQSPHEVLGGMVEMPGKWGGHSGNVTTITVCADCGMYKCEKGPDGVAGVSLREVPVTLEYNQPDEKSLAWCRGSI